MRFSLVLATLGRTTEIERLLASLGSQTNRDFELIVVDQNPDDRLVPLLKSREHEMQIEHLRPGCRGASRARNVGLERVSGDIVAFPDDDCWYPPDLLARVTRFLDEQPQLDGVTGRSVEGSGQNSNGYFDAIPGPLDRINLWTRAIEYTIFLRRERVKGLRFDESLGVGAGTDWGAGEATDYLLRLLDQGASLYYEPDLIVFHPSPVPPYDEKALLKTYSYGSGMGHVLSKHKMPLWFKAKWLIRPLGGALLSMADRKPPEARYRWSTFKGRLRGLAS